MRILLGLACVSGHNWSVFLRFKGGKGVAITLGVLGGLGATVPAGWGALLLMILVWVVVFLVFRVVSLASVLSALSLPLFMLILYPAKELLILSIILSILIILRHKKNLLDFLHKQEHPLSFKGR